MANLDYTDKYVNAEFPLGMDFEPNLDDSETIDSTSDETEVTAKDNAGDDATAILIAALSTAVSDNGKILRAKVQAGTEALSPYIITFKAYTTDDNIFEDKIKFLVRTS